MRGAALVAAVVVAALAAPALAQAAPQTLTQSVGAVTATLTWERTQDRYGNDQDSNEHLTIVRDGVTRFDKGVTSHWCSVVDCLVASFEDARLGGARGPLAVADVEGDGQPDVILDLYTGGAHCCTVVQVYSYDPGMGVYRLSERNFGDPGASVADLAGDGKLEFESADDRFAYAFAPYAYSGLPLQIYRFAGGRFSDVTRSFPALVRHDAARWWFHFTRDRHAQAGGLGDLAAWAADEYLLERRAAVATTLEQERRLGYLHGLSGWPAGRAYIAQLKRLLKKLGY